MRLKVVVPSKTFLVGEYLALAGGPSLVISTAPHFEYVVEIPGEGDCSGIHPQSPAGIWMRQHQSIFTKSNAHFVDPHEGLGGFGASSAQYVGSWVAQQISDNNRLNFQQSFQVEKLWKDYLESAATGEVTPSGADVVSQWTGGICEWSQKPFTLKKHNWPFRGINFTLIRTGRKVATHEHLKNLKLGSVTDLQLAFEKVQQAFAGAQVEQLTEGIEQYQTCLSQRGFVATETQRLINEFKAIEPRLSLKGCGAMGADVLLCVYPEPLSELVQQIVEAKGLNQVATNQDLSVGAQIQWDLAHKMTNNEANL